MKDTSYFYLFIGTYHDEEHPRNVLVPVITYYSSYKLSYITVGSVCELVVTVEISYDNKHINISQWFELQLARLSELHLQKINQHHLTNQTRTLHYAGSWLAQCYTLYSVHV